MSSLDMYVDGAAASAFATLISNPFDVMRTRMQLQGELCKAGEYHVVYRNLGQGMVRVVREEGFSALQKGLCSAVLWQIAQNGIRIGLYPAVRAELSHALQSDAGYVSVLAGASCGCVGSLVASPLNLIKTRLQSQRNTMTTLHGHHLSMSSTGEQYNYRGVWDAVRKIYSSGGLRGLWRGSSIAAQRTAIGSASQLSTYDSTKQTLCLRFGWAPSDIRVHVLSAIVSASAVVLFMNPLDVVMTRCYNNNSAHGAAAAGGGPQARAYSSNLALATWTIYRVEGVRGLYKGSLALFSRSAPHGIATFVMLEYIRKGRERYTDRSYTSGSTINKAIGFRRLDNADSANPSSK